MRRKRISDNPFTLTFGREPASIISREFQTEEALESFLPVQPESRALIITGLKGAGKTVTLTNISNELGKKKEWVVVDLISERDMFQMLVAELCDRRNLLKIFTKEKINLSSFGIGNDIEDVPVITDITIALDKILSVLTKQKKKVLITIDGVTSAKKVCEFLAQLQIYLRRNYSLFLLISGTYEHINELQSKESLSFLSGVPKIDMKPLSTLLIAQNYAEVFNLSENEAYEMAKETKGYAYAFQLLGFLCYKRKRPYKELMLEYQANLEQYVYEKIWSELSNNDQLVLKALATATETKVESVRENAEISSSAFSVYRDRLIKKGLVNSPKHGYMDFVLPYFREFVRRAYDIY